MALLFPAQAQDPFPDPERPFDIAIRVETGRQHEMSGELAMAAHFYQQAYDLNPADTRLLHDIARVQLALDDVQGAITTYRRAPADIDVVEALANLLAQDERFDASLEQWRRLAFDLASGEIEYQRPYAEALAMVDAVAAEGAFRGYLDRSDPSRPEVQQTALKIASKLEEAGEEELARLLLEEMQSRAGEGPWADRLDRLRVRHEARQLAAAEARPLTPDQQSRLRDARRRLARGEPCLDRLEALAKSAPRNPDVFATLSRARESAGDIAGAEQAVHRAMQLDPMQPEHPTRFGDLLATHHAGRYDAEAADAYQAAIRLRGSDASLWRRKADIEWRMGRRARALQSYRRVVALDPSAADVAERIAAWERELPELPRLEAAPARKGRPPEAEFHLNLARVYHDRESADRQADLDQAMLDLLVARQLAPDWADPVRVEAEVVLEMGNLDRAVRLYEESLKLDRNRGVMVQLARLYERQGRTAESAAMWKTAEDAGAAEAILRRAEAAAADWKWWKARDHLDAYFSAASLPEPGATVLEDRVERNIRAIYGATAASAAAVVILPVVGLVAVRRRRRSGVALEELLARAPAAFPDVARVCSAIRHEVLKHNTTVLSSVSTALEEGDGEPAKWAAEKLFAKRGAIAKFRTYVRELETLGRVHGVRLNLRYRDPVFAPLIGAVDRLDKLDKAMRAGSGRRLARDLSEISMLLNETGYRGLGRLIHRVVLLPLDADLLRRIAQDVMAEPAFHGQRIDLSVSVEVPGQEVLLRIFETELEDILVNLIRNAVQAGTDRLGLRVLTEEDDITGLERVSVRVCDDAPRRITTAMIRGRYIERGLGLAVDLISRNGGSVHVEDEPGWSKAIVVRLPRAEMPSEDSKL